MNTQTIQRRGKWTKEEDEALVEAIRQAKASDEHERLSFTKIVKQLSGRTPKQAQERWENHLRPGLKRGEWSKDETYLLLDLISKHNQEWSVIAKSIPNRGFHSIKVKGRCLLRETLSRKKSGDPPSPDNKSWSEEEVQQLLAVHENHGYDYDVIFPKLLYLRPVAEIERKLFVECHCYTCHEKMQMLSSMKLPLKAAWSMMKSSELKKRYRNTKLSYHGESKSSFSSESRSSSSVHPEQSLKTWSEFSSSFRSLKRKNKVWPRRSSSSDRHDSLEGSVRGVREKHAEYYELRDRRHAFAPDARIEREPRQATGDRTGESLIIEPLNEYSDETQMLQPKKRLHHPSQVRQFLDQLHDLACMMPIETVVRTFERYLTKEQVYSLLKATSNHANFKLLSPTLNYLLSLKMNSEFVDPRYDLDFMFPSQCNGFSDSNRRRPVGTILFENTTCLALDSDRNANALVGSVLGRHWFECQASPLNAFFLFGNLYAKLIENGEVWCRQLFTDVNGKMQVYLTHVQFGVAGPSVCKFRMQNISDDFPEIMSLPPDF